MPAPAPSSPTGPLGHRFYHPELDVLRLVAFALVFLHHIFPRESDRYDPAWPPMLTRATIALVDAGGFGLSLFFFLSAFLITWLLLLERDASATVSVRDFLIRRAFRIWPLYLVGLGIGAVYVVSHAADHGSVDSHPWLMMAMYALMIGNWFFAAGGRPWPANPATPLWSISIEEQFYLFWPWVVKRAGRRGVLWASLAMLAVAVAVEAWLGEAGADRDMTIWTNSFVAFELFAAGALTALWLQGSRIEITPIRRLGLVLAAGSAWFAASFVFGVKAIGPASGGPGIVLGYGLIASGAVALFLAVWGWRRWPPAIVWLGRISYGLYVFHLVALFTVDQLIRSVGSAPTPWIEFGVRPALALGLTVALAAVSYRVIETPFLRLKTRFASVPSRPV